MSLKNNINLQVNSVIEQIHTSYINGTFYSKGILTLTILNKLYYYSLMRYNTGDLSYFDVIKSINKKIQDLKYKCPGICKNKDVFVMYGNSTFVENCDI